MYKTFKVKDVFAAPLRGKGKLTKTHINANPGKYPVFSARRDTYVGLIDTYDFNGSYLSWTTNGYAGATKVLNGKFSVTADRALLKPLHDALSLEYCALVLEPEFRAAARGRLADKKVSEYTKLRADEISDIEFLVPITEDGSFDQEAQAAFVTKQSRITAFQQRASELEQLISAAIVKPQLDPAESLSVGLTNESYFEFISRRTEWFKAEYIRRDTGNRKDIPVYSAAKEPVAHVAKGEADSKLIEAGPENRFLSFGADGEGSAGTNFVIHDRPFLVCTNRTVIRVLDPLIHPEFVFHSLQTMKADYGFGFSYKPSARHLADVTVDLPLTQGKIDLDRQMLVSSRLTALGGARAQICEALAELAKSKVATSVEADEEQD